jgi:Cellulase (glycosyl hydrolase family 5)
MFIRETFVVKQFEVLWSAAMRTEDDLAVPRTVRAKTALTTAFALAAALAGLTAALGYVDGTGLFAPENWLDAGTFPGFATSPAWATVTYLPLLIVGSAAGCYFTVRAARPGTRARWVLGAAWSSIVLTAFLAKLAYSVLLLAVAGPAGLHPVPALAAVLAECGLCGAKFAFFGVLAAAPAALAYWIKARGDETATDQTANETGANDKAPADTAPADTAPALGWSPVWLLAGALVAAAVAGRGYPWLEGSGRVLILPACGLAGSWLAARAIWPRAMAGLAVPRGPAACWASAALTTAVLRAAGSPPVIGDSDGRQVLLRGVNVNQLVDYGQPDKSKPTVRPLSAADYAQMASQYGFDVQRLNLSWSQLEPARGQFSQAYIARVRQAVDWAAAHGIYTVLDMHQDTYSKYVTAAPGTTCRLGASPEFGNDGAPAWATLSDGAKGCGFQGRDLSPNVEQSFTNLYDNTDGIGTQYADAWGVLAQAFARDTAVAGYDLLNEPGPGNSPGVTSALLLGRLYEQVITQIRTAEAAAPGGFHHLVFFEPSILWSGLGFDVTPPAGFSGDPDLVFSPHLYSQSITMDQGLGVTLVTIEQGFALAMRTAAAYGVPLWSGEWGWFGTGASDASDFDRFLNQQNADELGSAIWVWKKACGDPQSDPNGQQAGGLDIISCVTGKDLPSPAFQTAALGQAYPRSAPGRLSRLASTPTTVDLSLAGNGTGTLDVWIPGAGKPTDSSTGLRGVTLAAQPGGGWRLTGTAAGGYTLSVR